MQSIDVLDFIDMVMGDFFGAMIFLMVIYNFKVPIKNYLKKIL
jgi:hypothetical protein